MIPLPSRRHFLKASAFTAAALPFIPALSLAVEPKRKIGFALCGLGNLATNQIAPALQKTEYCKLAGIITGTPEKAKRWQAQYNLPDHNVYNYDTMAKLADNPDIDVVYVVTPNGLHADHTIAAAKAGKHVLCEKPMEVSPEKCQQMIDACKTAGKQLAIGYRLHFDPNHLECIRLVREKVLGSLKFIEAGFGFAIGDPKQWRLNKALSGGGPMMDVGIYALQAMRYLSGEEPVSVSAIATTNDKVKFRGIEESLTWQLAFPSGILANGNTTYGFGGINRFLANTDHGWLTLNPAYSYHGLTGMRSDGQAIQMPDVDQFAAEMDDFAQCILENRPTRVPGEEGLRDMKIITAIYESVRTGKAVKLT
ncbi:MAG TPA: Gfo/Idh/MocA family oxidoreductase [Verrucomicrobiae bacterium]|nr:Gfo/Idh/MocA family oxidoreductase [Verrucomicrobiae bacterium]